MILPVAEFSRKETPLLARNYCNIAVTNDTAFDALQ
jgi:hypothetical protein